MSGVDEPAVTAAVFREDFPVFYAREFHPVLGLAFVLLGDRSAAEDVAQEAFIAALRSWDRVAGLDDPGAWVRRVAANQSVSWFRRKTVEAKALLRLGRSDGQAAEISAETGELWDEVRHLPRRQAQAVALHYLDQRTIPEVGLILGCSENTVKTHLQRARETLARRLDEEPR